MKATAPWHRRYIHLPEFDDPNTPVGPCVLCGTPTRQKDARCVPCRTGIRRLSRELGPAPEVDWPEPGVRRYTVRTCVCCGSSFRGGWTAKYCSGECRYMVTKRRWETKRKRRNGNAKHD